jgi:hypothetical protein
MSVSWGEQCGAFNTPRLSPWPSKLSKISSFLMAGVVPFIPSEHRNIRDRREYDTSHQVYCKRNFWVQRKV